MASPAPRRVATFLALGIAALALDFAIAYTVALAQPNYSHRSQFMSELAVPGQPLAGLMALWWVVYGVCLVMFAAALRASLPAASLAQRSAPWLVAAAGLGLGVGGGLFPCDAGCSGVTPSGQAHTASAMLGSLALVAAPFAYWFSLRARSNTRPISLITIATALVGLGVFLAFVAASSPGSPHAGLRGLLQRLFLVVYYIWLAALAVHAYRAFVAKHSGEVDPAAA